MRLGFSSAATEAPSNGDGQISDDVPPTRLIGQQSGRDYSDVFDRWARRQINALGAAHICGYVFKQRSPSCGPGDAPLLIGKVGGIEASDGNAGTVWGRFAEAVKTAWPELPVLGDEALEEFSARHHFLVRVYARHELGAVTTPSALVAFHTRFKLALLASSEPAYRKLGPLVAAAGRGSFGDTLAAYGALATAALTIRPSPGGHVNALEHAAGFFKHLPAAERTRFSENIRNVMASEGALEQALAELANAAGRHQIAWLADQRYLAFVS